MSMVTYNYDADGVDAAQVLAYATAARGTVMVDRGILRVIVPENVPASVVSQWVAAATAPIAPALTLEEEIDAILNRAKVEILAVVQAHQGGSGV